MVKQKVKLKKEEWNAVLDALRKAAFLSKSHALKGTYYDIIHKIQEQRYGD